MKENALSVGDFAMSLLAHLDRLAGPLTAVGLALWIGAGPPPARAASLLGDGAVIDSAAGIAYVARPQGGIEALDLATGKAIWLSASSAGAAKPLVLLPDGQLLTQAEPGPDGALRLATLDAATGGEKGRFEISLPPGIRGSVSDSLAGTFRIRAATLEGESAVVLAWTATAAQPLRGYLPPDLARDPREPARAPAAKAGGFERGAARFEPATGRFAPASDAEILALATAIDRAVGAPASSAGVQGLPSIDGRHALRSDRVAGSLHTYRWSIADRTTGAVVAVLDAPVSLAPFVLAGPRVVYLAQPSVRREEGATIRQPLRLRALDLATGGEAWQVAVRDSAYRGPVPP